jgi:hypothetical protein
LKVLQLQEPEQDLGERYAKAYDRWRRLLGDQLIRS